MIAAGSVWALDRPVPLSPVHAYGLPAPDWCRDPGCATDAHLESDCPDNRGNETAE